MKRILYTAILSALILMPEFLMAQIKIPAASPAATIKQSVGLAEISIEYSRPRLRGRELFKELIPEGEVWRTGANMSTTLTFSEDVTLEGNEIPAGKYSLYSIPGKQTWTIIINKKISWGTQYDPEQDLVRFDVKTQKNPVKFETFTFYISDLTDNSAIIGFKWGNIKVGFDLGVEVDSKVMAQIDEVMSDPETVTVNDYYSAASYYYNNDKDMEQALEWINKYASENADAYWGFRLKAQIHAALGQYNEAITAAEKSIELAKKAGNQDYVRNNNRDIKKWQAKK